MQSTLSGVPARLTGSFQSSAVRGVMAPLLVSAGLLTASCSPSRIDGEEGSAAKVSKEPGKPGPTPPIDPAPAPCKKVDVLFVVDNSGSMADNQQSLIASFPGFVDGMKKYLASAEDVHIGVVTSDSYYQNDPACTAIGSLVTKTGGPKSSGKRCDPYDSGSRFLTTRDPLLKERFACAAQVGAGGSDDERMARALLDAVAPKAAAPGKCNAGFLRPDSLLVVVMITDEDDVPDAAIEAPGPDVRVDLPRGDLVIVVCNLVVSRYGLHLLAFGPGSNDAIDNRGHMRLFFWRKINVRHWADLWRWRFWCWRWRLGIS